MSAYSDISSSSSNDAAAIQESAAQFESDLAKSDTVRGIALTGLQRLRAARTEHVKREQAWLATTLGADHPEVVRLNAELEAGRDFDGVLGAEIDRVNATPPVVNERGWVLHGFVRNQQLQGQAKLTVALFDRSNRWIESLGHTCTDERGYFQLRFVPGKEIVLEQGRELFVHISDPTQKELYCDKKPMLAVLGEIRYREIILGAEPVTCSPPASPKPDASTAAAAEPDASTATAAEPAKKTRAAKKAPKTKKA
jgi:hypothetical protein